MSLFTGLKKCECPGCENYIYEKDAEKYTFASRPLCSIECVHLVQLNSFIEQQKDHIERIEILKEIKKHMSAIKEEIKAEYQTKINETIGINEELQRKITILEGAHVAQKDKENKE